MMNRGVVSAVVYIWYPEVGAMGHASMYIGDPLFGKLVEHRYDGFSSPVERERHKPLIAKHNKHYVSWWPSQEAGLLTRLKQDRKFFLEDDIKAECAKPHVIYTLYGLDVQAMRCAWMIIHDKPDATYHTLHKNCASVVLRVLRAGGALHKLSLIKQGWFSGFLYVTPKHIAQICNELRDAGHADKVKDRNCPEKGPFSFGLR